MKKQLKNSSKDTTDYDIDCSGIIMPQKGDPKYDIRGISEYCKRNNINMENGAPKEVAEMFRIGTY